MRYGLGLLLLIGATACGGSVSQDDDNEGTPSGGTAGSGGKGGKGGTGGRAGAGSGGTGAVGGKGGTGTGGAVNVPDEVTLEMGPFEVSPGTDTYRCQNFANPFGGVDVEIAEFETHMTEGSHHLVLNYAGDSGTPAPEPCSGLEAPSGPFATQAVDDKLTYPAGIAAPLAGNQGLRINSHYFNTTPDPFKAIVTVTLRRAKPGTVKAQALTNMGLIFDINVPPHSTGSVSGQVSFSEEVRLLSLMPHMHSHGTRFVVNAGNKQIFETDDWETPPHVYDPPLAIGAGQPIDFSCDYLNDGDIALNFGESAAHNEMCILITQYYRTSEL
jgi:hypothetical protein